MREGGVIVAARGDGEEEVWLTGEKAAAKAMGGLGLGFRRGKGGWITREGVWAAGRVWWPAVAGLGRPSSAASFVKTYFHFLCDV